MSKIQGRAKKFDGTAIDYVSIFDWSTGKCIAAKTPNSSGAWEYFYFKNIEVGLTYIADGCEPVTHGKYSFLPTWNPISLFYGGTNGAWYDVSDISTLFKDTAGTQPVTKDGDVVALMRDKSGNSNHMLQSTSSSRPIYRTDGILQWLEFDGVDDYMVCSAVRLNTPLTQTVAYHDYGPYGVYRAIQGTGMLSEATGFGFYLNDIGSLAASVRLDADRFATVQKTAISGASVSQIGIYNEIVQLRLNNSAPISSPHTFGLIRSNVGLTIGARIRPNDTTSFYSKIRYYGSLVVSSTVSDDDNEFSRHYLAGLAGAKI